MYDYLVFNSFIFIISSMYRAHLDLNCRLYAPLYASLADAMVQEPTAAQWRLLAIVRNPIERFASGFVDKCYKLIRALLVTY
jgi:hypothetical protein